MCYPLPSPRTGLYPFLKNVPQNVLFFQKSVRSPSKVPITGLKCRYIVLIYAIWEKIFKYFDGLVTRNSFLFYFSEEILWFWLKELKILNKVVSFLLLSFRSLFIRCISIKVFFHNFSNYNISFVRGKLERLTTTECILWSSYITQLLFLYYNLRFIRCIKYTFITPHFLPRRTLTSYLNDEFYLHYFK